MSVFKPRYLALTGGTMKVEIKNRFTAEVIFSADVKGKTESIRLGLAVKSAISASVSLQSADLQSADLRYTNLRSADLRYANLRSADLWYADLQSANLWYADLQSANLQYADLRYADLQSTNLRSADLRYTNLRSADLWYADLQSADLRSADLRYADLQSANLRSANLQSADLRYANLPSPTMMLLASWFSVSAELTADLMEYDAALHPDRKAFTKWAKGGPCPYADVKVQRAANFQEDKTVWGKGKLRGAYSLMLDLFKEKNIKF